MGTGFGERFLRGPSPTQGHLESRRPPERSAGALVFRGANQSDSDQLDKNLLLSDTAEVDSKPELEIYADDVKCAHGATVGQLDQDMLFYLRSRSIDEATARSLLTYAFADEILREIGIAPLRRSLEQMVIGRLPDPDLIREFAA